MRIPCPFCGERENGEFVYLGDAKPQRPELPPGDGGDTTGATEAFYEYVYMRDNIAGTMREYWYHGAGCRAWLVVERNTLSHEIISVRAAPGAGAARPTTA